MQRQSGILLAVILALGLAAGIARSADITSDLLAYWPLDSDAKDVVGGHDGKPVGGASFVSDAARGKVLKVDGKDGHVEVPHADDIVFTNSDSYTLSVWVSVLTVPGHWAGVVNKSRDASPWYGLWIASDNKWCAGGSNIKGSAVKADGWHHVAIVQDGAANKRIVYVDGAVDVEGTAIDATGGGDLWMGGAKSVNEYFEGLIDDVTLYKRALSSGDIQQLMAGPPTAVDPASKLATTWGAMKH